MNYRPRPAGTLATLFALFFCVSSEAAAESGQVFASVNRVMVTGNEMFGGCMAALSVDPQTVLPDCQSWWVSFSCSGAFTDPTSAYRLLDNAQLALATNKKAYVFFRDDLKHNGYCFADRIDVAR
jgi:hypothetical protein